MPTRRISTTTWDPFVRVFHWSLVTFFFLAYLLEGDWLAVHSQAGYTIALLLGFRLIWGFIGTTHARFADFVTSPRVALEYLRRIAKNDAPRYEGHDPAGAVMIVTLLTALFVTAFTGMTLFAMEARGPLSGTFVTTWPGGVVERIHELAADVSFVLILIHVAGVLFTSFLHRENLIKAMFTGRKKS